MLLETYINIELYIPQSYNMEVNRLRGGLGMEHNWLFRSKITPAVIEGNVECMPEEVDYEGERIDLLNRHFQSMIDRKLILSGSYCMARDGKVFADNSLGHFANDERFDKPFEPDTIYNIASITKEITAVAILKLVEDGMIRLDQHVCEIIDEFNTPPFNGINILQIITHTSGLHTDIGTHEDKYAEGWWKLVDENDVAGTWITAILKKGLRTPPGTEWSYSSAGYMILGEIISRVSGIQVEDYIREYILKPCEMTDTHWRSELNDEIIKRHNIRTKEDVEVYEEYLKIGLEAMKKDEEKWNALPSTAGGLMSTSRDLAKFGLMILNDGVYNGKRIIGRKALEMMRMDQTEPEVKDWCWGNPGWHRTYGVGTDLLQLKINKQQLISNNVISHEGYGNCCMMIDYEEQFVAVWSAQYYNHGDWYGECLRNVASIMWSGLK